MKRIVKRSWGIHGGGKITPIRLFKTCGISQSRPICGMRSMMNSCSSSGSSKRIMSVNFGLVCLRFVMLKIFQKWRYGSLTACGNRCRAALCALNTGSGSPVSGSAISILFRCFCRWQSVVFLCGQRLIFRFQLVDV